MPDPIAPMDCHAAMRQLWDFLDGELSPARYEAVQTHLAACASCYQHEAFERRFLAALAAAQAQQRAAAPLHARVMQTLRAEGFGPRYGESFSASPTVPQ